MALERIGSICGTFDVVDAAGNKFNVTTNRYGTFIRSADLGGKESWQVPFRRISNSELRNNYLREKA